MRRRPYRLANIASLGVALAVALACTWWRERYGPHPIASNGGVIGLTLFLVLQIFYDSQSEVAHAATNGRIDVLEGRVSALERRTPGARR